MSANMEHVDCVVIGAGAVGLACARLLAMQGHDVMVLEQADSFGTETSSRNSEVIHAGIYYPEGSLKALLCVKGKALLYRYCEERGVAHRNIGKLIVASSDSEVATLDRYREQTARNGVTDLSFKSAEEIAELEPAVKAVRGLFSPSTGIIDSHEYMQALIGDLKHNNGMIAYLSKVSSINRHSNRFVIKIEGDNEFELACDRLVNSAGLHAWDVARLLDSTLEIPARHYARGHYYTLGGKAPFSRLIYPVAEKGGLGIHVTLDLAGQVRFGPDVQWIDEIDYRFDEQQRPRIVEAIKKYYPDLDESRLQPSYTGIRPKIAGASRSAGDFVIQAEAQHGIPGLVNLFGIESPGLTSSLAIAEEVTSCLR